MAKEKEPKERLLRKLIPHARVDVDGSNFIFNPGVGSGWEIITATNSVGNPTRWAVWRGYFDLSGIVEQQETLFTIGPVFQEGCDWDYVTTNAQGTLQVWDMITQEYITDATFDGVFGGSGMWVAPGLVGSGDLPTGAPYELQDVHYGNARSMSYGPITSLGGQSPFHPLLHRSVNWGVGSATAGQKLYLTRAIHLESALRAEALNNISSPPTAIVIPTLIVKEPDLHYIERLRRSYVVQPTVD